jgi:hypothetical protein
VRTCTLDLRFESFGNVSLLDIYSESPVRISYDPFRGGSSVTLPSNWQLIVNVSHALARAPIADETSVDHVQTTQHCTAAGWTGWWKTSLRARTLLAARSSSNLARATRAAVAVPVHLRVTLRMVRRQAVRCCNHV